MAVVAAHYSEFRWALARYGRGVLAEVEAAPEDHVLQADDAAWAKALSERYSVEPPVLRPDEMKMEPSEPTQVDVSKNRRYHGRNAPGHRTVVHVPFSGERAVFEHTPTSFTLSECRARLREDADELLLEVVYADGSPLSITDEAVRFVERVERELRIARDDVGQLNASLEPAAVAAIQSRRQRIQEHRAHLSATGLPLVEHATTSVADVLVFRPAPLSPAADAEQPIELEPALGDTDYERILRVIRETGTGLARAPGTFAQMGEEDLRHVLLTALNTHEGIEGVAEAFNVAGKTDILVRHQNRDLFVAECKLWSGPAGFTKALGQLFGYQAWNDTKLALIVFVRDRALTGVIERGREALKTYPQFVAWQDSEHEAELRATVHWQGDPQRHAELNVFFISLPGT